MSNINPTWIKEIIQNDNLLKNKNNLVKKEEIVYIHNLSNQLEKFDIDNFSPKVSDKKIKVAFFRDGPFLPITTGAANSIYGMINALVDQNVEVFLIHSFRGWSEPDLFKNKKFSSLFVSPEDFYENKEFIKKILKKIKVKICHFDSAEAVCLQKKLLPKNRKVVFEVHNVENELVQQLQLSSVKKIKKIETKAIKQSDAVIVRSESNYQSFIKLGCEKNKLFKYRGGINVGDINFKSRSKLHTGKILFLGHLNYGPNEQAVRIIAKEIAPFINKKFLIAGKGNPLLKLNYSSKNVIFLDWVSNLNNLFSKIDVALAPIITGSGTRIKILDYMAAGIPVVGTNMAIEGLEPEIKNFMIVEDDFKKYKQIIEDLYANPKKVKKMSLEARKYVLKNRDWNKCIKDVIRAYSYVLKK
ncbi:MAG: glycosyltransferase family 4 protein [Candidatus Shapirobacteria bacterium]